MWTCKCYKDNYSYRNTCQYCGEAMPESVKQKIYEKQLKKARTEIYSGYIDSVKNFFKGIFGNSSDLKEQLSQTGEGLKEQLSQASDDIKELFSPKKP